MSDNMQVDICAIIHEQDSVYCKLYVRLSVNKCMDNKYWQLVCTRTNVYASTVFALHNPIQSVPSPDSIPYFHWRAQVN